MNGGTRVCTQPYITETGVSDFLGTCVPLIDPRVGRQNLFGFIIVLRTRGSLLGRENDRVWDGTVVAWDTCPAYLVRS